MPYLQEFLIIASVHLLAVASPGPDFAVVLKQSLRFNRKTALYTSIGIGSGILLHVTYSLLGIGLLIASDERLFTALKLIAAAYFLYIAWHSLRAKPHVALENQAEHIAHQNQIPSAKKAFITGFLVNGLNVKATLFFVGLFSMVINPETPTQVKLFYGIYMAIATAAWFSFLSIMLTHHKFRSKLVHYSHWIERVMGALLLVISIELLFSQLS